MKNDTVVSLLVALLVIVLVCVPVMAANVTYPQEYSDLGTASYEVAFPVWGYDRYSELSDTKYGGSYDAGATRMGVAQWMELRRQTILMEKQNELLAEQNELMGRLVNATEIKFECKATGYVQQASYWSIDDPEVNASDYHYNINPADVVSCENATISERFEYGCHS